MTKAQMLQKLARQYEMHDREYHRRNRQKWAHMARLGLAPFNWHEDKEAARLHASVMEAAGMRKAVDQLAYELIQESGKQARTLEEVWYAALDEAAREQDAA